MRTEVSIPHTITIKSDGVFITEFDCTVEAVVEGIGHDAFVSDVVSILVSYGDQVADIMASTDFGLKSIAQAEARRLLHDRDFEAEAIEKADVMPKRALYR
jgi:hypothetical protein